MSNPLTELQTDLEVLAKPGKLAEPLLTIIGGLLKELEKAQDIGAVFTALNGAIEKGFTGAAEALKAIAGEMNKLEKETGNKGQLTATEVASALSGLQNALSTASTLVPGTKSATAVAGPFLGLLSELLTELKTFPAAIQTLNDLAEQLETIGKAF